MAIVSNATPLIAFAKIGQLSLLQKTVKNLVIPDAVADEISAYPQGQPGFIDLQQETWVSIQSVTSEQQVNLLLPRLDRGEAEVIALALERKAQLVLIDELTARKVATSLNLNVSGSVGILIRAKQVGETVAVKPLLDAMTHQGIYFSQRFIDAVLQQVGEA
jgi:predicted nucleic acid-binding protein